MDGGWDHPGGVGGQEQLLRLTQVVFADGQGRTEGPGGVGGARKVSGIIMLSLNRCIIRLRLCRLCAWRLRLGLYARRTGCMQSGVCAAGLARGRAYARWGEVWGQASSPLLQQAATRRS